MKPSSLKLIVASLFFLQSACSSSFKNTATSGSANGNVGNLTNFIFTLAGSDGGPGSADGVSANARFSYPTGIVSDGTNIYVADSLNYTIRKIVIATGTVTTFAGTAGAAGTSDGTGTAARFTSPAGMATDGTNLYVIDAGATIRKIVISTGVVTTFAGTAGSFGSTDATGTAARFKGPTGIASDGTNLYVADTQNDTIRKVVIATAAVTTLAGTAGSTGSTDGTGAAARFTTPQGLTTDGTNVYVSDTNSQTIRQIVISTGVVTTLAGSAGSIGGVDGTGTAAKFNDPNGIVTDGTNLYIADTFNNAIRKLVISTGVVTTFAGSMSAAGSTDGTGAAARFQQPNSLFISGSNIYISDYYNNTVRRLVTSSAVVTTVAGDAANNGNANGTGTAASFESINAMTTDGTSLYVTDGSNEMIRKIVISTGVVTTLAGSPGAVGSTDGTGAAARFDQPSGIATDGTNLYVADSLNNTIRKIVISTGVVTTLAGTAGSFGTTDGTGSAARFNNPWGITTDGTNLYVTDKSNYTIRQIVIATGVVTTIAGTAGVQGSTDGTGTSAQFTSLYGITNDGTNLYVTDYDTIREIVISNQTVTTLAGVAGVNGTTDGASNVARFNDSWGITTDGTNLYVADYNNSIIRLVVINTGVVSTIAGLASQTGSIDGPSGQAYLYFPQGIALVSGVIFFSGNYCVREFIL